MPKLSLRINYKKAKPRTVTSGGGRNKANRKHLGAPESLPMHPGCGCAVTPALPRWEPQAQAAVHHLLVASPCVAQAPLRHVCEWHRTMPGTQWCLGGGTGFPLRPLWVYSAPTACDWRLTPQTDAVALAFTRTIAGPCRAVVLGSNMVWGSERVL